jgi:hypothetical protein
VGPGREATGWPIQARFWLDWARALRLNPLPPLAGDRAGFEGLFRFVDNFYGPDLCVVHPGREREE